MHSADVLCRMLDKKTCAVLKFFANLTKCDIREIRVRVTIHISTSDVNVKLSFLTRMSIAEILKYGGLYLIITFIKCKI